MVSQALVRAGWLWKTIRLVKNWPEVYWRKFVLGQTSARQELRLRNGLSFEVVHKDHAFPIIAEVLDGRIYESAVSASIANPVVIDIGGNIGVSAIYFLTSMPTSTVLVFEPEPTNFGLLQRNLAANGFESRSKAIMQAVGGAEGPRTLFFAENSPTNSMFREVGAPIEVECTTLAKVFEQHHLSGCDVIKIDCEGAEYEILMTAPRSLLARIRRIILEWHDVPGHTPEALEQYLADVGFATHRPGHRFIVAENKAFGTA